jgi:trigger factor
MQVSVTATGGLERRMEVAVPAERVRTETEKRLQSLSRTARLKGFRPGKAPYAVIRQQFGEQVHAEVIGDLMRSTLSEAVDQQNLKPAHGPRIEAIAVAPGDDLKYAAVFEILPEVRVKSPQSITLERPTATLTEEDVDAMLESMRKQRPTFTPVEREARQTDRVTVDFRGRLDGEVFKGGEAQDVAFVVGAGGLVADFEAAVRGMRAGESKTTPVSFPPDYSSPALAGKTAEFDITVKRVEEQGLPPLDEEFAKALGVTEGGMAKLREEIRESMQRELVEAVRLRLRNLVLEALYRDNPLEIPHALLDEKISELQVDMVRRLGAKNTKEIPPREPFEEPARRQVALGMLLAEIIRAGELKIDRTRVQERLHDLASRHPNADEMRRTYLQNPAAMRQIEAAVLEDQAVEWVVERANVQDKASTFREVTGFSQ